MLGTVRSPSIWSRAAMPSWSAIATPSAPASDPLFDDIRRPTVSRLNPFVTRCVRIPTRCRWLSDVCHTSPFKLGRIGVAPAVRVDGVGRSSARPSSLTTHQAPSAHVVLARADTSIKDTQREIDADIDATYNARAGDIERILLRYLVSDVAKLGSKQHYVNRRGGLLHQKLSSIFSCGAHGVSRATDPGGSRHFARPGRSIAQAAKVRTY
jgi:hypothetical protein